jgi:hypothetical protein
MRESDYTSIANTRGGEVDTNGGGARAEDQAATAEGRAAVGEGRAAVGDMQEKRRDEQCGLSIVGGILPARVASMRLSVRWNDQGWGNAKGAIEMKVVRGGQLVAASRVFGIAPHQSTEEMVHISAADHQVLSMARPGDRILFGANVGHGGGHRLTIDMFRCGMIWTSAA